MGFFTDKTLMITGGTGSFGNAVLKRFLDTDIKEIRIYADDRIIHRELLDLNKVDMDFTVSGMDARYLIRVELAAENEHRLAVPTPFYFQRG